MKPLLFFTIKKEKEKEKGRGNYISTLNYTPYFTLHPKLFECTFCTLNYDFYYTLHPDIKFTINLDENLKFRLQM